MKQVQIQRMYERAVALTKAIKVKAYPKTAYKETSVCAVTAM